MPTIKNPVRVSLISASVGIALIAVLATYLRRKRRRRPTHRDAKADAPFEVSEKGDGLQHFSCVRNKRGRSPTTANGGLKIIAGFWFIWFINQRASYNHALSVVLLGCHC